MNFSFNNVKVFVKHSTLEYPSYLVSSVRNNHIFYSTKYSIRERNRNMVGNYTFTHLCITIFPDGPRLVDLSSNSFRTHETR